MKKVGKYKTNLALDKVDKVGDFLGKTFEVTEEIAKLGDALEKAAPWVTAALGPVGLAATAFGLLAKAIGQKVKVDDPREVRLLAITMAWQFAAVKAIRNAKIDVLFNDPQALKKALVKKLQALPTPESADLATFSYNTAHIHPFVRRADEQLRVVLQASEIPVDAVEQRRIFDELHRSFVDDLRALLVHPDAGPKLASFATDLAQSWGEDRRVQIALETHAEYQREIYAVRPLFKGEPFSSLSTKFSCIFPP
jgi:hypothetical protein